MAEERIHHLQSVIKKWLQTGAQCNSSLKPYARSIHPTYRHTIRIKQTDRSPAKFDHNQSIKANKNMMIQMCEDFLRHNRDLINI